MASLFTKYLLVLGGCGNLGSQILKSFPKWKKINIDFSSSKHANYNILLEQNKIPNSEDIIKKVLTITKEYFNLRIDTMVCASGFHSPDQFSDQSLLSNFITHYKSNIESNILCKIIRLSNSRRMLSSFRFWIIYW